jgi:uncharacterized membrane protein YqiK
MTGSNFGTFLLGLLAAAIVVAALVWILRWLYIRSSKDRAFVRTGLGGQKVVLDGGAFVVPVLHEVIPVNMSTVRLQVERSKEHALITKDRMRVDVMVEFFVRVQASPQAVAAAAQTLGAKTLEAGQLGQFVEGKFVDALRTVAASMSLEDLHEKRGVFVKAVREAVSEDLLKNGLDLESASLTQLDQTSMEYFNPSNAFDAEGLTRLTQQIEQRKKERNDVEQNTTIAIRSKNLETEKLALEIERESEYARLAQQREVEVARVRQRAELVRERAEQDRAAESVQISAREAIEAARIRSEQTVERERIQKECELQDAEVKRRTALELAEQQRAIAVAERSRAQSEAQAAADVARAQSVLAEERVYTTRELEAAERRKAIELIAAAEAGEKEALRLRLAVEAEKQAAGGRGEAIKLQAQAEAEAEQTRMLVARLRAEVEAEAARLMNESHNMLSADARASLFRQKLLDKVEGIVRESVRPLERIEGIKILNVNGLGGTPGIAADAGAGLPEQVVNSALRFRVQAPLIDGLLKEIGIHGGGTEDAARALLAQAAGGAAAA